MKSHESRMGKKAKILLFLGAVILSGCTPDPVIPYPAIHSSDIDLKHTKKVVEFVFRPGSIYLTEDDIADLERLLNTAGPGRASVHATFPLRASGIYRKRIKMIIRYLMDAGVTKSQIHFARHIPKPCGNKLWVVFHTYRAIPPVCPNWSRSYGAGDYEMDMEQFGCTDKVSLVQSVVDPVVLFKSEKPEDYDTTRPAMGIQNYRIGKEKQLKIESTSAGSSGSTGGSTGSSGSPGSTPTS